MSLSHCLNEKERIFHPSQNRLALTSRPGNGYSSVLYANIQCLVASEYISSARMTILHHWTVKRMETLILNCFTKFQIFEKSYALVISIMSISHFPSLPDPSFLYALALTPAKHPPQLCF